LSRKHRVEVDVDDCVGLTSKDWIEFRKNSPDARDVGYSGLVRFEHRDEILLGDEFDLKAVTGFLFVRPEDLERTPIVGRHQQVVSIFVREVTIETREVLLDHPTHRVIGRVAPAIERNMNQRFHAHCDSLR